MTAKRIIAIILIFALGVVAWVILGQANWMRSQQTSSYLSASVQSLWGAPVVQQAPKLTVKVPGTDRIRVVSPSSNQVEAIIDLEQRRKGLLWYPTYTVDFSGRYQVTNEAPIAQDIRLYFSLPSDKATYENVVLKIGAAAERLDTLIGYGFYRIIPLSPGASQSIEIAYQTRGINSWTYLLGDQQGLIKALDMTVKTNFTDVDFIGGSLSPMQVDRGGDGLDIHWRASELITRQNIGISLPQKLNPGPLAARMSFFAPVCLLFFFVLITSICVTRKIDIHPMHYLFVNAGFFAFHLLFAYTIDLINVHLAFGMSAIVSVALVVSYLARALGPAFPWKMAALGQMVYLVLFSYSFFLKGMTGLTVTVASIITLAILMKITAQTDWSQVFVKRPREA
ncbi:MAG: inner membrane CreD family protein [Gammaproteobacteria bacterium]|nr:inner membrane CreD family protein [Gammaproteobacteria bacterium]